MGCETLVIVPYIKLKPKITHILLLPAHITLMDNIMIWKLSS
jgi:hypothetical protein